MRKSEARFIIYKKLKSKISTSSKVSEILELLETRKVINKWEKDPNIDWYEKLKSGMYKMTQYQCDYFFSSFKIGNKDECWPWNGFVNKKGYGIFYMNKKAYVSTRILYSIKDENIKDFCMCHKCDNPICINPNHLWKGTKKENNFDRDSKGRTAMRKGEDHPSNKLMEKDVIEIRKLITTGMFQKDIASMFGVTQTHISQIKRKKAWSHL